jgi:hypothetical protein
MATIDIYVFSIARSMKMFIWNYMSKIFVYWYKLCLWCLKTTKRQFLCKMGNLTVLSPKKNLLEPKYIMNKQVSDSGLSESLFLKTVLDIIKHMSFDKLYHALLKIIFLLFYFS